MKKEILMLLLFIAIPLFCAQSLSSNDLIIPECKNDFNEHHLEKCQSSSGKLVSAKLFDVNLFAEIQRQLPEELNVTMHCNMVESDECIYLVVLGKCIKRHLKWCSFKAPLNKLKEYTKQTLIDTSCASDVDSLKSSGILLLSLVALLNLGLLQRWNIL